MLDLRDFRVIRAGEKSCMNFDIILNDPNRIIAEIMGGVEPGVYFTKKALLAGKSVCTSNKELVARHGRASRLPARITTATIC